MDEIGKRRAAVRARMSAAPAGAFLAALRALRQHEALLADAPVIGTVWERGPGELLTLRIGAYGPGNDAVDRDFETRQRVLLGDVETTIGLPEAVIFGSDGRYFETRWGAEGAPGLGGVVTARLSDLHALVRAKRPKAITYCVEPLQRDGGLGLRTRAIAAGGAKARPSADVRGRS